MVGFVKHICEFEKLIKNITCVTLQLKTKYVTLKTVYYYKQMILHNYDLLPFINYTCQIGCESSNFGIYPENN